MINYPAAKAYIESTYEDRCTVYEKAAVKDASSKITGLQENSVLTDQPCRLSFKDITAADDAPPGKTIGQMIKLFLAPEITIKPGSRVDVTRTGGIVRSYISSGLPAVYPTHQEIILQAKGWA